VSPGRFQLCLEIVLVCFISWFSSNLLNNLPPIFFSYFFFRTLILFLHLKFHFSPLLLPICLLPSITTVYYPLSLLPLLMFFSHFFLYFFKFPIFLFHFFSFITLSYFFPFTSSSSNYHLFISLTIFLCIFFLYGLNFFPLFILYRPLFHKFNTLSLHVTPKRLQKKTISLTIHVCPSVCLSHGTAETPNGIISINIYISYFHKNLLIQTDFV